MSERINAKAPVCMGASTSAAGPTVIVIDGETMGRGNDELGTILLRAFLHTAVDLEPGAETMIFYNAGVRLAATGSACLDDLQALEKKGVRILLCGTCVNYFNLTGQIEAGVVSNMYDIAGALYGAGRIIKP